MDGFRHITGFLLSFILMLMSTVITCKLGDQERIQPGFGIWFCIAIFAGISFTHFLIKTFHIVKDDESRELRLKQWEDPWN